MVEDVQPFALPDELLIHIRLHYIFRNIRRYSMRFTALSPVLEEVWVLVGLDRVGKRLSYIISGEVNHLLEAGLLEEGVDHIGCVAEIAD